MFSGEKKMSLIQPIHELLALISKMEINKRQQKNYDSEKSRTASVIFSKHLKHCSCGSQASLSASPLSKKINLKNRGARHRAYSEKQKPVMSLGTDAICSWGTLYHLWCLRAGSVRSVGCGCLWGSPCLSHHLLLFSCFTEVTLYPPVEIAGVIDGKM